MRWDERSSTTLHRPLPALSVPHANTRHTHTQLLFISFTCPLAVPLRLPPFQHLLTYLLFAPSYTYKHNLQLWHSLPLLTSSHTRTCTLFSPVLFPYVSFLLPHEVRIPLWRPSTALRWGDIRWQHCFRARWRDIRCVDLSPSW